MGIFCNSCSSCVLCWLFMVSKPTKHCEWAQQLVQFLYWSIYSEEVYHMLQVKVFISSQIVVVSTYRKNQTNRKFTLPLNPMWKYFYFIKMENDSKESLFSVARNSLIAFRGIKQSLPTMKKGVQKICWQHTNEHSFRK